MKKEKPDSIRFRIVIIGITFSLFFMGIAIRAMYLQVYRGSWLSEKAANQYTKTVTTKGHRGIIFDANLGKMAISIDVTSVGAHPKQIENVENTATRLSECLALNQHKLLKELSTHDRFIWVKRHITPKAYEAIKSLNLKGIVFTTEQSRFYPHKFLAGQILGFTGIDNRGLEGIEFNYDYYLKGKTSTSIVIEDALGRWFGGDSWNHEHNGNNLILTIDRKIQYITETALVQAIEEYRGKSGIAIVMAPETGAVLALAHYPFFNPNAFKDFNASDWRNRAITDPYEPGSTMKIFSAAAALESGKLGPHSIFFCENGVYQIGINTIHDTTPHAWLSLQQILKYSSNIGAAKVIESIGAEKLFETLRNFGFGEKTGIDCPGESSGRLSPFYHWAQIDTAAIAFGQGISVTAIQLITAACAIANDGILMRPYVVEAITDTNGMIVKKFGPHRIRRAISTETARVVKRIMATVMQEDGTGVRGAVDGYTVCGKTGTSQKIGENGAYVRDRYVASFIGFAPAKNPAAAVLVIVDEPQKKYYGGIVAAPAFKAITSQLVHYLNIPPDGSTDRVTASVNKRSRG
jgi:cell division protein FtsI (penicillin-binding protein 3)